MVFEYKNFWNRFVSDWTIEAWMRFFISALLALVVLLILAYIFHWSLKRSLASFLLVTYLILIFATLVFTRASYSTYHARTELFWSYKWGIEKRGNTMVMEIIMNILLLLPVGFLFPVVMGKPCARLTIFLGFFCTCSIEALQYFLKRGLFEFDDIIHNTLGVIIGYILWRLFYMVLHRNQQKTN